MVFYSFKILFFYNKFSTIIFAPACVPQAVVVGVRIVCYNIRLWDTSEGVNHIFLVFYSFKILFFYNKFSTIIFTFSSTIPI
ncbi:MAG: hypothetical protein EAZ85_13745 [Bacteroidetes bacterium]|nr:MAG: hypothetical protein EAZ85_13745 [Bacteroidota bacterium]